MGRLWCGKDSRQCKTMPSGPPEFIPVTGMKCSYGKFSRPLTEIRMLTEISGTERARPLIWTHRKFYKGFRGKVRSRKPGQLGQPSSYEEAFTLAVDLWQGPHTKTIGRLTCHCFLRLIRRVLTSSSYVHCFVASLENIKQSRVNKLSRQIFQPVQNSSGALWTLYT